MIAGLAHHFGRGVIVVFALCAGSSGADPNSLFDGRSFAGWTTLDGKPVTRGWKVVDGTIHLQPSEPRAGHIISTREFEDLDLSFDWKIAPVGNSGLKYRVRDYDGKLRGLEYQILDDAGYHKRLPARNLTGSIYDLYAANDQKHVRPPGKFNSSRIVVRGDHVEHWLNGKLIVTATIGDAQWQERVAESKFNEYADFARNPPGRIMLTDHGSEVWYRNLQIHEHPAAGPTE